MIVEFNPCGGDFQLESALFLLEVRKVSPNHVILDPKVDDLPFCPMQPSNQLRFFSLMCINLKVSLFTMLNCIKWTGSAAAAAKDDGRSSGNRTNRTIF